MKKRILLIGLFVLYGVLFHSGKHTGGSVIGAGDYRTLMIETEIGFVIGKAITRPLGDQRQALLWLVNAVLKQGWTIEPGHVLLTGALGKMIPGKRGNYIADYGGFGKITFDIKFCP